MSEKRRFTRFSVEAPVKCKFLDNQRKNEISYEVLSKINNLSEGGACLSWPKSWRCGVCNKCLVWIFNHNCALKEEPFRDEMNRYISAKTIIRIEMTAPLVAYPLEITAKVAWVKPDVKKPSYDIGISFMEDKKGRLKKLRERILELRKKRIEI